MNLAQQPAAGHGAGVGSRISVVIPTYNRCAALDATLSSLVRQRLPRSQFDVVVADDGSADATRATVESYRGRLQVRHTYQEDLGFRAAAARNAGAWLAQAPILLFLDTGVLAGPDTLTRHLAAHRGDAAPCAVAGYVYGYRPAGAPSPEFANAVARAAPERVLAEFRDHPEFADFRDDVLTDCDFDLGRFSVPWTLFWSGNCSVPAREFWAAGGFDEDFRSWGFEDVELGFRLHRRGLPLRLNRDAWVIEAPQERDETAVWEGAQRNIELFLRKHPEPVVEIGWGLIQRQFLGAWDSEHREMLAYTSQVRGLEVSAELAEWARDAPASGRIVVMGAGAVIPAALPPAVLMDFDRQALKQPGADGHVRRHSLGLRTPLENQAVDTVIITSRMAGVQKRWGEEVLAEARRIGRSVQVVGAG